MAQIQFIYLQPLGPCLATINQNFLNRAEPFPLFFFLNPLAQWTCHTIPEKFEFEGICKSSLFHLPARGGDASHQTWVFNAPSRLSPEQNPKGDGAFTSLPSLTPAHAQISSKSKDHELSLGTPRRHHQRFEKLDGTSASIPGVDQKLP